MKRLTEIAAVRMVVFCLVSATTAHGQGTLTFNDPWVNNGVGYFSLVSYDGMSFGVGDRTWPYDNMRNIGAMGPAGYSHNGTPYIGFVNTLGTSQYQVFAWTDAASFGHSFTNGAPFGLISVDLADPVAPSLAPVFITFNGFKTDGSMVSQTFTMGGGGSSSFQRATFGPDFSDGLLRVEIPSARWAMDNLVWIPEPASGSFLLLGLLALAAGHRRVKR